MTAQIMDTLLWGGDEYNVVGVSGGPLFDPADHNVHPVMLSTACYRGFYLKYVASDRLRVVEAVVGLDMDGKLGPPTLLGASPTRLKNGWDGFKYTSLSAEVPFNGGLLIGRDFIRTLYVHMGFHPAWKYRQVKELMFDAGELVATRDLSSEMAHLRERLAEQDEPGAAASSEEIRRFVERAFSLEYPGLLVD